MSQPEENKAATESSSPAEQVTAAEIEFPVARVSEAAPGLMRLSRMWWVTLACLLLAMLMAWRSMPATGPEITIHFPEGHGLKAGDTLRYRGIEVGSVTAVSLSDDLSAIDVNVTLTPGAGTLDREGTRFWIVRPRLSLTEISGLETAVGAKYIGVSPGKTGAPRRRDFDGLAAVPPDELDHGGLEIILRSDDRHGTSTGAPVTWRGVKTGTVLSVNLAPDARHVNITVRVDRAYRRLVRPSSKFWVTSGFGIDVGLTGLKLNAQSLTTIVQGGISFISPVEGNSESPVQHGHVFALADEPEDEWLEAAANIPLVDFELPETVSVSGVRASKVLGFTRKNKFTQTGLVVSDAGRHMLLTPSLPVLDEPDQETVADFEIQLLQSDVIAVSSVDVADTETNLSGMMKVPVAGLSNGIALTEFRAPSNPEDCLVVRSAVIDGQATPIIQAIDIEQLLLHEGNWSVHSDSTDFSEWHGAPVVALADGKIIGFLQTDSGRPVLATFRRP